MGKVIRAMAKAAVDEALGSCTVVIAFRGDVHIVIAPSFAGPFQEILEQMV